MLKLDVQSNYVFVAFALYTAIGIALLTVGPMRRSVSKAIADVRGNPLTNALLDQPPVSETKSLLFGLLLAATAVLLWPVMLASTLNEERRRRQLSASLKAGLWFQYMGGAGTVSCEECTFSGEIVSFLHGWGGPDVTGYQCASCGRFTDVEGSARSESINGGCKNCGGTLTRNQQLVCPDCKSARLHYDMEYIT